MKSRFLRQLGRSSLPALLLLASCAKKGPPSGGPPDIEAPRLIGSQPDSGAAAVRRDAILSLTFSEGMEPRSTGDAIALAPPATIRRLRWSGRTVSLELAESLRVRQSYTLFVGNGARDRHGNPMEAGGTVVFTTADSFPPGAMQGRLEARGFAAPGTYLWFYDEARGHAPDSTGRDFDAIGLVDAQGDFRVPGLAVPGRYKVWAFGDLDGNRSFEPERDVLAPVDTVIALTRAAPVARELVFHVVNPRAPATAKGTVIDSLHDREGELYVLAIADTDSTRRVLTIAAESLQWIIQLDPGDWTIRAFRDADHNRAWDRRREAASDPRHLHVGPADVVEDVTLELKPAARAP